MKQMKDDIWTNKKEHYSRMKPINIPSERKRRFKN